MIPAQAIELAKRYEGLRLKAYLCPAGVATVGYGATGPDIKLGMEVSVEWAEERIQQDVAKAVTAALRMCPVLAVEPEARLAAVVDFVFNLGAGRLQASTLRRRVNQRDWGEVAYELRRWVFGGGTKLPGLIARREAEAQMILSGG